MFAVSPKEDCPHLQDLDLTGVLNRMQLETIAMQPCQRCDELEENWLCLSCEGIFCSRYVNGHMAQHNEAAPELHPVAFSLSDASFWCYLCDNYVISPKLTLIARKFSDIMFPSGDLSLPLLPILASQTQTSLVPPIPEGDEDQSSESNHSNNSSAIHQKLPADESEETNPQEFETSNPLTLPDNENRKEAPAFTYQDLVDGIASKKYDRIVFLTGAGISVAAGIPDFRTPGTGLYAKVSELGLPYPEAIFSLEYLRNNPEPFYKISNGFLTYQAQPVKAHHFMKQVQDRDQLLMVFTQNIDGLEVDVGIHEDSLVQAHGHMRSAHCCDCHYEVAIETFFEFVAREEVLRCAQCAEGVIKPDVIFFGENLPFEFFRKAGLMKEADLVIVMGTSLKVFPFAGLIESMNSSTPLVLINRENNAIDPDRENFLFIEGDIESSISLLAENLGWTLPNVP